MKKKFVEVYLSVYKLGVIGFFGGYTPEQIKATGVRKGIRKENFTEEWMKSLREARAPNTAGFCMKFGEDSTDILLVMKGIPGTLSQYSILFHEIFHAVDMIAEAVDQEDRLFSKDGMSEARAYIGEYIMKQFCHALWPKLKKKKT